jgi:hypothetical protein
MRPAAGDRYRRRVERVSQTAKMPREHGTHSTPIRARRPRSETRVRRLIEQSMPVVADLCAEHDGRRNHGVVFN